MLIGLVTPLFYFHPFQRTKGLPLFDSLLILTQNIICKYILNLFLECGINGALLAADTTTELSLDNRSAIENQKDLATAATGLIGNLEVLRRLSGKQFQSYTTALVATVAVGCFLLILNILIFAGIYHQREKRARDAKTKEELQENESSKNSSLLKLNALGLAVGGEGNSLSGSLRTLGAGAAGGSGKSAIVFGEYSCYDEKTLSNKMKNSEKLMVEMPIGGDTNWNCSASTLDLIKVRHHQLPPTAEGVVYGGSLGEATDLHLHALNSMEMASYTHLPAMATTVVMENINTNKNANTQLSKNASFDYAVQSSDKLSFKEIEAAVKGNLDDAIREQNVEDDDDIPEPPPPPKSFQAHQQQQQQQQQGILRQSNNSAGNAGSSTGNTSGGGNKKRVHIQEISV